MGTPWFARYGAGHGLFLELERQHVIAPNRNLILAVLTRVLPDHGSVLKIAGGSGEHATYFAAAALPTPTWQPSNQDPVALGSIAAH